MTAESKETRLAQTVALNGLRSRGATSSKRIEAR